MMGLMKPPCLLRRRASCHARERLTLDFITLYYLYFGRERVNDGVINSGRRLDYITLDDITSFHSFLADAIISRQRTPGISFDSFNIYIFT